MSAMMQMLMMGKTSQPIQFVNSSSVQNTTNVSGVGALVIPMPSGVQSGDLLIAFVSGGMTGSCTYSCSGWTLASSWTSNGPALHVFYKTAGGSEPSMSVDATNSNKHAGTVLAYRNADFDVSGPVEYSQNKAPPNQSVSGITVTNDSSVLITCATANQPSTTFGTPSGFTSVVNDNGATEPSYRISSKLVGAGATGSVNHTFDNSANLCIVLLSLRSL